MILIVQKASYNIYKYSSISIIPPEVYYSAFYSVTKSDDELSIVTEKNDLLTGFISVSTGWVILKVEGPLEFTLTGIIAGITAILATEKIPVFTISTFETDYFLIRKEDIESAITALGRNGHIVMNA